MYSHIVFSANGCYQRVKFILILLIVAMPSLNACSQSTTVVDSSSEKQHEVLTHEVDMTTVSEADILKETMMVPQTEESWEQSAGINSVTTESENNVLEYVITSIGWPEKKVDLSQVQRFLDAEGIKYQGTFNRSKEKITIVLEDGGEMLFLYNIDSTEQKTEYRLIQSEDIFDKDGFCDMYNESEVIGDKQYGPDTISQIIDESYWRGYSQTQLSLCRNQIYARHGRIFEDTFLREIFSLKTWYQPQYDAAAFAEKEGQLLSDIEKENIKRIVKSEIDNGYRKDNGQVFEWPVPIVSGSWLDLDGDGVTEQIHYIGVGEPEHNSNHSGYQIQVDGSTALEEGRLYKWLYAASLDGDKIQLLTARMRNNDDGWITAYNYEDGCLVRTWGIPGVPEWLEIAGEEVYTYEFTVLLQLQMTKHLYRIKNGEMVEEERGFYEIGNEVRALIEIPTYNEKGGSLSGPIIQPEDAVIIVGGDNREWLCIQKKVSGEIGWIKARGAAYAQPDGTMMSSEDVFKGVTLNIYDLYSRYPK